MTRFREMSLGVPRHFTDIVWFEQTQATGALESVSINIVQIWLSHLFDSVSEAPRQQQTDSQQQQHQHYDGNLL